MYSRMKLVNLVSAFCALASAIPQDSQLSLGGSVINSVTGEPVAHASVQIQRLVQPDRGDGMPREAKIFSAHSLTDASGGFRFAGLEHGEYSLFVEKPQFELDTTRPAPVELTSSILDLKVKLSPLSVISGRVVDQDGQPVWLARVVASSVQIRNGLRTTVNDRSVTTDERGMFRMWNLQPGRFFLKVSGRGSGTYSYVGDVTPQFFGDQAFAPLYYGGGRTLDEATALEIVPGSEIHAELKVKTEPAYAIRGTVANFTPTMPVHFELLKDGESLPASPASLNAGSGRFEIQSVMPGTYTLRATQNEVSADAQVSVTKSDVEDLELTMRAPVEIPVETVVTGAAVEPQDSANGRPSRRIGTFCRLSLHPSDGRSGVQEPGGADRNSLRAEPGRYRMVAFCFGGYAQSILWGTQDLLSDPFLEVRYGESPPPIVITASKGGGTVRGKLPERKPDQPGMISVLIVPQFAASTGPLEQAIPEAMRESGGPGFEFANLAPGTYLVYAFAGRENLEYRNARFLQSLTGGVSVQVEDNSQKEITLSEVIR